MPRPIRLVPRGATVLTAEIRPSAQPLEIGRDRGCDVVIPDLAVSRRHARLSWEGPDLVLEDLGSSGGTYRNGARVERCALGPGDVVRFGRHVEYAVEAPAATSTLHDAARRTAEGEVRHLQLLLEVARTLNTATVLDEVLDLVLQAVVRLTHADRAFLSLASHDEGGEPEVLAFPRHDETLSLAAAALLERALGERRTAVGTLPLEASDSTLGDEAGEAAATPLLVVRRPAGPPQQASFIGRVELIGGLAVGRALGRGGFGADELAVLESLAADAATAIDSARLYRQAREKAKIDHEMALARTIQVRLLQPPPPVHFATVAAWSQPARSVGGDLYHAALRADGRLALALGDVSGKGVAAALLMSMAQGLLELLHGLGHPLADLLPALDQTLRHLNPGNRFLTLAAALLSPDGSVELANAGHCPVAVLRRDGAIERVESSGPIVGILPQASWKSRQVALRPGDALVFYSDGILESAAPDGAELGLEGIERCLAPLGGAAPEAISEALLAAAAAVRAGREAEDDVTVLVARYEGV